MTRHQIHEFHFRIPVGSENELLDSLVKEEAGADPGVKNQKVKVAVLDVKDYDAFKWENLKQPVLSFLTEFDEIALIDSHHEFDILYYMAMKEELEKSGFRVQSRVLFSQSLVDLLGYMARGKSDYFYVTSESLPQNVAELAETKLAGYMHQQVLIPDSQLRVCLVGLPVALNNISLIHARWVVKNEMNRLDVKHPRVALFRQFLQRNYPGSAPMPVVLLAELNRLKDRMKITSMVGKQLQKIGLFTPVKGRTVVGNLIHEIEGRHFGV